MFNLNYIKEKDTNNRKNRGLRKAIHSQIEYNSMFLHVVCHKFALTLPRSLGELTRVLDEHGESSTANTW